MSIDSDYGSSIYWVKSDKRNPLFIYLDTFPLTYVHKYNSVSTVPYQDFVKLL